MSDIKTNLISAPHLKRLLILLLFLGIISSCSRKKDKWLNRNFHALTAYNNILYNGNNALKYGKEVIKREYIDDYWEPLPLERIPFNQDKIVFGKMIQNEDGKILPSSLPPLQTQGLQKSIQDTNFIKEHPISLEDKGFHIGIVRSEENAGGRNFNQKRAPKDYKQNENTLSNQNTRLFQNNVIKNRNQNRQNQEKYADNNRLQRINNLRRQRISQNGADNYNPSSNNYNALSGNNNFSNPAYNPNSNYNNPQGLSPNSNYTENGVSPYSRGYNNGNPNNANSIGRNGFLEESGGQSIAVVDTFTIRGELSRAELKATKAVQKHSMNIKGIERNPEIKRAFLLLGKSRYYQKKYFQALEAFNYILKHYKEKETTLPARIWKEKTFLRLKNYPHVLKGIGEILEDNPRLNREDYNDLYATLTETYIKLGKNKKALRPLSKVIQNTRDKEQKARALYLQGQLYQLLKQPDSADIAFDQIIALKRQSPRIYSVQAQLQKTKNFDVENGDKKAFLQKFEKLLHNRENRPYLDLINYQLAEYYREIDSMPIAIHYYNRALDHLPKNYKMRYNIYKTLGDYYFKKAQYQKAGAYYDSTMINLPEGSLKYFHMKKERERLSEVLHYEKITQRDDSILSLAHMTPIEQKSYFTAYTDSLKKQAIQEFEEAKKQNKKAENISINKQFSYGFYFYNPQLVLQGEATFRKKWGNRILQDNWREKNNPKKKRTVQRSKEAQENIRDLLAENPKFKPETYLHKIPSDPKVIDSLSEERNFARYQLGLLYNEEFKKHDLARHELEVLLEDSPEKRLVLPTKYYLYKAYKEGGKTQKAEQLKEEIINDYPGTPFAKMLIDPENYRKDSNNPVKIYNRLYKQYQNQEYLSVIEACEQYAQYFNGQSITAKFSLLEAMCLGRLYGVDTYEKALTYVAYYYPRSEEAEKATTILSQTIPTLKETSFTQDPSNYRILIPWKLKEVDSVQTIRKRIEKRLSDTVVKPKFNHLSTTVETYNQDLVFIIIKGFTNVTEADEFKKEVNWSDISQKKRLKKIEISLRNYEVIQIHKNLEQYLKLYNP